MLWRGILPTSLYRESTGWAAIPNEAELSKKLEVSGSTAREAIKTLVSQNILEIRRGSGTFVCNKPGVAEDPPGFRFISDKIGLALDSLEIRLVLEPHIAEKAAEISGKKPYLRTGLSWKRFRRGTAKAPETQ